eukprot:COSAG02_NODE_9231_length_2283_cov_1.119048_2_plen_192_part_00
MAKLSNTSVCSCKMAVLGYACQVRRLSLDEVYSAIVKHKRRPLMVTFIVPDHLGRLQGQDLTPQDERQQPLALGHNSLQHSTAGGKEENESDTHRASVRRYLAENGMEACTDGVCRALAQHGTERSQWLSTLTSMGSATRRDLLEAVRAQYARESPLRSLGKFGSHMTGCKFILTLFSAVPLLFVSTSATS